MCESSTMLPEHVKTPAERSMRAVHMTWRSMRAAQHIWKGKRADPERLSGRVSSLSADTSRMHICRRTILNYPAPTDVQYLIQELSGLSATRYLLDAALFEKEAPFDGCNHPALFLDLPDSITRIRSAPPMSVPVYGILYIMNTVSDTGGIRAQTPSLAFVFMPVHKCISV